MSNLNPNPNPAVPKPSPLLKQNSWSPDTCREEVWLRRKQRWAVARRTRSLTDEDLDELKGCIDLGFGFDSPQLQSDHHIQRQLSNTLPALELYYAVNKSYLDTMSKSRSSNSLVTASSASDSDLSLSSPLGSPLTIFSPGEDPKTMKTRLRQWAQVVACSVKQSW